MAAAVASEAPDSNEPEPEIHTSVSVQSCHDDLQNFDDHNDSAIIPSDPVQDENSSVPNYFDSQENSNLGNETEDSSLEIIDYSSVPEFKVDKMTDKKAEYNAVRQNQNYVAKKSQQQPSFNYESILKFVKNGESLGTMLSSLVRNYIIG